MTARAADNDWQHEPDGGAFDTTGWHERIAGLYGYWRSLRPAPDTLPGRRHFDPVDVPAALASIWLLDVQREPFRLRYRLAGTNMGATLGEDLTGRWLDEARPKVLTVPGYFDRYRFMADTGRATWRHGPAQMTHDPYWHSLQNVMMPLAADGRSVDMLLCATIFFGRDGRVL
ncbi:MAG: PAS domain-containing protein, partial [Rhodospirillales bacterium]|nr:PAS domain-containing protein [Rhodospirillales bacterium]